MFFCDPCATERDWPTSIGRSLGTCELCGKRRECSDIPSKHLPRPPRAEAPPAPPTVWWAVTDGDYEYNVLATFERKEDADAAVEAGYGADVAAIAHYPAGTLPRRITVHRWTCATSTDPRLWSGINGTVEETWSNPTVREPECEVGRLHRSSGIDEAGRTFSAWGTDLDAVRAAVEYAYEQLTAPPDAGCVTAPDGACVSTGPCMHTPAA